MDGKNCLSFPKVASSECVKFITHVPPMEEVDQMALIESERFYAPHNPLDTFEDVVCGLDWPYERLVDEELTITMKGSWCDYHVTVSWHEAIEAIHISTALDIKVPEARLTEIYALLAYINEQQWFGHFDIWTEESMLMYRVGLPLPGVNEASTEQCQLLLQVVVDTCERYYPAFQFVLWAGKSAKEAIDASMFDTVGSA